MSRKMILVADDEPHLVRSLTFILQKEGYVVSSASNGEEAFAMIKESKPDLVFLDVMMPKRNGFEVCRDVRQTPGLQNTYIIMLTAKGQDSDRLQGFDAGANDFITKPFGLKDIVDRVKKVLG